MKTFGLAVAWGVLLSGGLAAGTYRINFTGTFVPVPPTGDIPASWGPVTIGTNGVFTLSQLFQNSTVPDHFAITTDYSVSGGFTIDSASGGFVTTPEPSTLQPAAFALALAAAGSLSRARPRRRVLVVRRQGHPDEKPHRETARLRP